MAWIEINHRCPCPAFQPGDETDFVVEVPEEVNDLFAEGAETREATGYGRCPNCGQWVALYDNAVGDVSGPTSHHVGKWALTEPEPGVALEIGCWVETERWGPAVVTGWTDNCVQIRYEAERCHDKATIWVANGENPWECHYLRPPDDVSRHVLTLEGPYGEGICQ